MYVFCRTFLIISIHFYVKYLDTDPDVANVKKWIIDTYLFCVTVAVDPLTAGINSMMLSGFKLGSLRCET